MQAFGRDVGKTEPLELRLAGLGYVPQERNVFPNLGVRENLETAYRVAGPRARNIDLSERLSFVEGLFPRLAERRTQHAGLMSGGEQRMVALGMGLMLKPQALLLDEPTTGLAPVVVHELMKTIRRLRDTEGISILLVEQNIASLVRVVDRLYVLKDGVCRQFEGRPEDLARLNIGEYL
jgi:branched-chain amino acid transport system ATP-binding protein